MTQNEILVKLHQFGPGPAINHGSLVGKNASEWLIHGLRLFQDKACQVTFQTDADNMQMQPEAYQVFKSAARTLMSELSAGIVNTGIVQLLMWSRQSPSPPR